MITGRVSVQEMLKRFSTSETVKTNTGEMPVWDYLDIQASKYGYEAYEDMVRAGYSITGYEEFTSLIKEKLSAEREYKVVITETLSREVTVKATSKQEAQELVEEKYYKQEIVLDSSDHQETEFQAIERNDRGIER